MFYTFALCLKPKNIAPQASRNLTKPCFISIFLKTMLICLEACKTPKALTIFCKGF